SVSVGRVAIAVWVPVSGRIGRFVGCAGIIAIPVATVVPVARGRDRIGLVGGRLGVLRAVVDQAAGIELQVLEDAGERGLELELAVGAVVIVGPARAPVGQLLELGDRLRRVGAVTKAD